MKRLTVLMPTYNVGEYIAQAIESILMQKVNFEFELIIVEDKSTDDSLKIALDYQSKYPDIIKVIENERNLKLLSTSIKCYETAKTEYFCVLDPDDYYIVDDKFQQAIDFLDSNPEFSIHATNSYTLDIYSGEQKKYIDEKEYEKVSSIDDFMHGKAVLAHTSGTVFRNLFFKEGVPKKLYQAVGTFSERSYEGDTFRNVLHLSEGKAYFKNSFESIYRISYKGVWTSLPEIKKDLIHMQFYYDMSSFFNNEKISNYMLRESYNFFNRMKTSFMDLYSLDNTRSKIKNPDYLIDFNQVEDLYMAYFEKKSKIEDLLDMQQMIKNKDDIIAAKDILIQQREVYFNQSMSYYESSISWKITKPLRLFRRLIGKIWK